MFARAAFRHPPLRDAQGGIAFLQEAVRLPAKKAGSGEKTFFAGTPERRAVKSLMFYFLRQMILQAAGKSFGFKDFSEICAGNEI